MFSGSTSIMGGMGTIYDANHVDADYAHIDGGTQNPGYLTPKNGYGMAANPTFTHEGNLVFINSATEGATIRYTIDGEAPTDTTGIVYSDSIRVTRNCTIRAIAIRENFTPSEVATYDVDWFKVSDVQFAQDGNMVTLSTTTTDATIFYTLSNNNVEQEYTAPLTMTGDCTIMAWATRDGYTPSDTTSFVFHAGGVTCSNPVFTPNENVITISTQTDGASIYYTTDGTDPTEQSTLYSEPITVDHNMTIKAIAMRQNYYSSQIVTFVVDTFKCVKPEIAWIDDQMIATTATEGAIIEYSLTQPGVVTPLDLGSGASPLKITVTQDVTINLYAVKTDWTNSDTLVVDYPYTSWKALTDAINDANTVLAAAANNDNVTDADRNALSSLIEAAQQCYAARTEAESAITTRTNELADLTAAIRHLVEAVNEPYAALSDNNTVLTFYYDKKKEVRNGMDIGPFDSWQGHWNNADWTIEKVVFDASFAHYYPTNTDQWFINEGRLTTIENFENLHTDSVTTMEAMFFGCKGLQSLDVSHFNTSNVTNMRSMFMNCEALTSINLSGLNTSNVKDMSSMFSNCYSLTSIDLSNFNTEKVTNMSAMFNLCTALTSVNLSSFNTAQVEQMADMFNSASSLSSLDLSSFNTAKVSDMLGMFVAATKLKTIYVGEGWTVANVTDSRSMFEDCTSLVGGKGTVYDAEHIDADYAHIDGGEDNPGYFTRSGDNPWVEPTEKLDPPVMSWNGDVLSWLVYQQYSTVMTWMSDTDVNDDSVVDDKDFAYYSQMTIQRDVTIRAFAKKEGMINSDTITIDYPYTAWQELLQARAYGMETISMCSGSPKVDQNEVEVLSALTTDADSYYRERKLSRDEIMQRVNDLLNRSAMLRNQLEAADFALDAATGVMIVGEGTTLAQALEAAGGSSVAAGLTAIIYNHNVPLTNSELEAFSNPNLLIYVLADSLAPSGRNNVVVDGVAENIVLSDATGNDDFYCPQAFTAERISYTREFNQQTQVDVCRGWETIALPFSVQTITHERNGVIAPFGSTDSEKHFWLRQLTQSGLRSATIIEANTPYLISMPNNTDAYSADFNQGGRVTFTAENAVVPVTTQHVTALADSTIVMVPTTMRVGRSSDVWALNVGQVRGAYLEGSAFERDTREVRPFEAYTVHRSNTPAPRFVPINDINGGNMTGIDALLVNSEKVNSEKWYDMNGRQLQQKPTKGGVYILNGKKVVLR